MARSSNPTSKAKSPPAKPAAREKRSRTIGLSARPTRPGPARKAMATAAQRPARVSKDELRAQIAKLEKTVETLRAKATAARKDARTAAARIADLEGQLAMPAEPQKPAASVKAPKRLATRPAKPTAAKARTRVDDIGETGAADSTEAAIDEEQPE